MISYLKIRYVMYDIANQTSVMAEIFYLKSCYVVDDIADKSKFMQDYIFPKDLLHHA